MFRGGATGLRVRVSKFALGLSLIFLFSIGSGETLSIGDFTVSIEQDPVTGRKVVVAYTKAVKYPAPYSQSALAIRCDGGKLDVFLQAGTYVDDTFVKVVYRIGDGEVEGPFLWVPSTNGTAIFTRHPKVMFKKLLTGDGKSVAFRIWDFQGTPLTYVFNLIGLDAATYYLDCAKGLK